MQSFVWFGLVVTTGICAAGATRIIRGARAEMRTRRRTEKLNRWVREENAAKYRVSPRASQRLYSS